MSLAFMNKKSWHTGRIQNIEKVWIAMEESKKKEKRAAELRKQFKEERQLEETRKMQVAAGLVPASRKMGWMYDGPAAHGPSEEDYLLGREKKATVEDELKEKAKISLKTGGSIFDNKKINQVLETETRIREDPMMDILKREQAERKSIRDNPVKMKEIKQHADLVKRLKKAKKAAKRAREGKSGKKHKKHKKKHKKRKHDSSSESEDEGRRPRDRERREVERPSAQEGDRVKMRGGGLSGGKPAGLVLPKSKMAKYGIIAQEDMPTERDRDRSRAREEDRDRQREAPGRGGRRGRGAGHEVKRERPKSLSKEEKAKRLAEMMADAETHEKDAIGRLKKARQRDLKEKGEFNDRRPGDGNAQFIKKLNKKMYMGDESLEDRLSKNKNTRQRGNTEYHKFLQR